MPFVCLSGVFYFLGIKVFFLHCFTSEEPYTLIVGKVLIQYIWNSCRTNAQEHHAHVCVLTEDFGKSVSPSNVNAIPR